MPPYNCEGQRLQKSLPPQPSLRSETWLSLQIRKLIFKDWQSLGEATGWYRRRAGRWQQQSKLIILKKKNSPDLTDKPQCQQKERVLKVSAAKDEKNTLHHFLHQLLASSLFLPFQRFYQIHTCWNKLEWPKWPYMLNLFLKNWKLN